MARTASSGEGYFGFKVLRRCRLVYWRVHHQVDGMENKPRKKSAKQSRKSVKRTRTSWWISADVIQETPCQDRQTITSLV